MAVLEAIGNIFRPASIGKPDATSDLELPVSVPIFLEEALPFRVVCRYSSSWFPYLPSQNGDAFRCRQTKPHGARLESPGPHFIN